MKLQKLLTYLGITSIACCIVVLCCLEHISFPWFDEIGTADTAINVVNGNSWHSGVWPYSYNFFHLFLLELWVKIFGVSHISVCSINCLLFCAAWCLCGIFLVKKEILSIRGAVTLIVAGWFFPDMVGNIVNGRIDMLAFLMTVVLICLMQSDVPRETDVAYLNGACVTIAAFGLFLAAVYSIPIVVAYCCLMLALGLKDKCTRNCLLKRGVLCAMAMMLAFVVAAAYQFMHQQLFRYLHTYISFNSNLGGTAVPVFRRIMAAYKTCPYANVVFGIAVVIAWRCGRFVRREVLLRFVFVGIIPCLMVLAGRFAFYYSWVYVAPVIICYTYAIEGVRNGFARQCLMCGLIVASVCLLPQRIIAGLEHKTVREKIDQRIGTVIDPCLKAKNVLLYSPMVSDDNKRILQIPCYYPLVSRGAVVRMVSDSTEVKITPKEKFASFLDKHISDPSMRSKIVAQFDEIEYVSSRYPKNPYAFVAYGKCPVEAISNLEAEGYALKSLCEDEELKMWVWLIN